MTGRSRSTTRQTNRPKLNDRSTDQRQHLVRRRFKEHRQWYADNVSIHKRGVVRERSMLRQLGTFFDSYNLSEIDRAPFLEWRTWRRRSVRASTINREHEVLSNVLNVAVPAFVERNVLEGVGSLHTEDFEARIVTPGEEVALLRAATEPVEAAAILCGLDALLRRGSVASLSRGADHGSYLTILNAKCGTYKVPVSTRLRRSLDSLSGISDRYFEAFWPQPENNLTRMFQRLCEAGGVTYGRAARGVTFHSLRHTGATRMLSRGVDVKTVMAIGGWRDLKVLNRYLHPTDELKRIAVEKIAADG